MKSNVFDSLPWPFLVGAKFLQVHPVGTICAILLALPGQIALIASFLLPIKIIMLMASEGMPRFIPSIAAAIDKKTLISLLAGLSIAAFIFHHLTNKAIQAIARSGASRIENRNQKLHLFEGQEELTRNSYTRYIDTVASINFVLLGTALLFIIYPEVASTFVIYIAICIVGFAITRKFTSSDAESFTLNLQKKLPTLAGIGFFLIFSWVLTDYILFSIPESFIVLLISVILGRQLLTRTSAITNSLFFFKHQQQKLRALLFHREAFQPTRKLSNSIWDFLDSATTSYRQLQETLKSIPKTFESDADLTWHDSGVAGVGFLTAQTKESEKTLLIKLFEKKKTRDARHEAALLLDAPESLPCPSLISDTIISGISVHILDITGYSFPAETSPRQVSDYLALSVSQVTIPKRLLSRYVRSHTMLWDQLDESKFHQLTLISENPSEVRTFLSELSHIKDRLKNLPLSLHNPQLKNTKLYIRSPNGNIELLHWGRWVIEPLGVGLNPSIINEMTTGALAKAGNEGATGEIRDPHSSLMVALLSRQLHTQLQKQLLWQAINTIKQLTSLSCNGS